MKGHRGNPGLTGQLINKSIEGYILALETINRLSIRYRVETFCYLICNAWELLLKAKILKDTGKIRIQNTTNEPTYLMAPVARVSTSQCCNVNLSKLKHLLHRFFDHAPANVQVTDAQGNYHTPKEWFSVPIETIETAVRLLISGEIVNYRYDSATGQVILNA